MEPMLRDIRLALRRLRLAPGFTVFAIASLALGIGVSTAIYSAVRTLFWMPLRITEPDRVLSWTRRDVSSRRYRGRTSSRHASIRTSRSGICSRTWYARRCAGAGD